MGRSKWVIAVLFCAVAAAQQAPPLHVGGDVLAPRLVEKQEPQYSDEARKAKLQGTVLLSLVVGENGQTRDIRVMRYLGFGLDENAVTAVSRWRFEPGTKAGQPVPVVTNIEVNFRLLPDPYSWHLSRAAFVPQEGVTQPTLLNAPYPAPGPEHPGTVAISFDVDEQGTPTNIRVEKSSAPELDDEVTALIREWRFQAAMRNGIPFVAHAFLDFTHGLDLPTTVAPGIRPSSRKRQ